MKKFISVGFTGFLGLLLLLAGFGLVTFTQSLLLYVGITLLALALFFFLKG